MTQKIEEAKRLYKTANAAQKYVLESLFPELKESEDERIRKEIIEHIKWSEDNQECAKEEMIRWVAWLEKQGEQRPAWKPSDEQMEALKGVQEGVFRLGILESLYNDLMKLREK